MTSRPTASRIVHGNATTAAGWKAARWGVGALAVMIAWIWLGGASVHSFLFFLVGIALLGFGGSAYTWYMMRRHDPESIPEARRLELAERARAEAAAVKARLAATKPFVTYTLLAAVLVPTILEIGMHGRWVDVAGLVKGNVRSGEWWRLLTMTYLHGGFMHIWFNGTALFAIGRLVEAYAPRERLALVYLLSGLGGSVLSTILSPLTPSVGASGAIMGLVGYLLILARRHPSEMPRRLAGSMIGTLVVTAYMGAFGFAFIDNACHLGGAATGALFGVVSTRLEGNPEAERQLRQVGWLALVVLVAGSLATCVLLIRGRA